MNQQSKATQFSLFVHVMFFLAALAISQQAPPMRLPVALDLNILPAAGLPDAGPSQVAPAAPPAPQPPAPVEKKVVPKPVVQKTPPVAKKKPVEEKKPPVETVPVAATAPQSQPREPAPAAAATANTDATATGSAPSASAGQGGGSHGGVFAVGQLDGPLAAISKAAPVYPAAAKRRNIEGWIKVKFLVDEQGQVDRVSVLEAEPEGIFDQAVLRCISAWRFKPGTKGGVAVKALVEQTITFKLEG
jgi:protein TonB